MITQQEETRITARAETQWGRHTSSLIQWDLAGPQETSTAPSLIDAGEDANPQRVTNYGRIQTSDNMACLS